MNDLEHDFILEDNLKEKAIKDIDEFLTTNLLLKDEKYSNILFGEFKNSLISTRDFLDSRIVNEVAQDWLVNNHKSYINYKLNTN